MWQPYRDGVVLGYRPFRCIIFSDLAISKLAKYSQRNPQDPEAGGLMLGVIRGAHYEVMDVTVPLPLDHRSRFAFFRNDGRHLHRVGRKSVKQGDLLTYLGEWHTHPEDFPNPSHIDISEWTSIASNRDYPIIFLIVGRCGCFLQEYRPGACQPAIVRRIDEIFSA